MEQKVFTDKIMSSVKSIQYTFASIDAVQGALFVCINWHDINISQRSVVWSVCTATNG